ncbi:uncharacterized protein LOC141851465 [Brevipalpus obovatus]|uniref:uncharacterized protein LOC141851465 n=1 Tax=Brevipalpus obovatus TaxID=246614 RepID=UPI003D9DC1D6
MDDETYFDLEGNPFYGGNRFACKDISNIQQVPHKVRFFRKSKFGPKLLMWIAISSLGRSRVYFHESRGAVNGEIYSQECIRKRLRPFINLHNDEKIFWPDLASAHYAKGTIATYNELGTNYVTKDKNPPNVPQLRPIETFWSHLKAKVYYDGWTAKNFEDMKKRIRNCLKNFGKPYFERLFQNTKKLINRAEKHGVEILLEK